MIHTARQIVWFEEVTRDDVPSVGEKNASLGETISRIHRKRRQNPLWICDDGASLLALHRQQWRAECRRRGARRPRIRPHRARRRRSNIRSAVLRGEWSSEMASAIVAAYRELGRRVGRSEPDVAVRSSATAEDLPNASFAGQQETYLNIRGERALLDACRRCYASLFTDRAISYRKAQGFDHMKVALSVGVQIMVRSDTGGAGVMFSLDTETGFDKVALINASWGLGENVVQGAVDPDEYVVFKPFLPNAALSPIIEKKRGGKLVKMIYAQGGEQPTRNVPTSKAERASFVLADEASGFCLAGPV